MKMKRCVNCEKLKPLDEFHKCKNCKDGLQFLCKECHKQCRQKNRDIYAKEYYENIIRKKTGKVSMYKNKGSPQYLGIVVGERLCKHLFKDVKVMPYGFSGYDIVCNRGKKIDVKSGCPTIRKGHFYWQFNINKNTIADYFILVAFDNRKDLNPLHMWMLPGVAINDNIHVGISSSTVYKWKHWERDIDDVQLCCNNMKR